MATKQPRKSAEKFTVCVDASGKHIKKTLREMTAEEVLSAMEWNKAMAETLEAAAKNPTRIIETLRTAGLETASPEKRKEVLAAFGLSKEALDQMVTTLKMAYAATDTAGRLVTSVFASMPQVDRYPGITMKEALQRFWPPAA